MPPTPAQLKDGFKNALLKFFTKSLPSIFLSLSLFVGGIALLAIRIPGWSLILGLPAVQIGLVFLIFTFDDIARNKVGPQSLHMIPCSVCGKPTLTPNWEQEKICMKCQQLIAKRSPPKKT
jgi:hypothetical protein